jgi:photosystem II stability/assembly factor-like uncharacterized protein
MVPSTTAAARQKRSRARRLMAAGGAVLLASLAGVASLPAGPTQVAAAGFAVLHPLPDLASGRIWSVAVDQAQPQTILVGSDRGVYRSSDGGTTWQLTLTGVRVWTVGFDQRSQQEAFAGTAGSGVFASSDAGATWSVSSTGLTNQDVRALAFGLDGIAAGTDSGVDVSPDGHAWHDVGLDGDSISSIAVAANSPQFTLIAGADNGNLSSGYLFRSTGGSAWEVLQSGLPAGAVASSLAAGPIDQAVPKRPLLVATSKGVFRSGDGGDTWTAGNGISAPLTLTTVTFGPLDPSLVYAGADAGGSSGGDLVRSTDSGMNFGAADAGLPTGSKNVVAIAVAPTNPPTVVVALDPPSGPATVWSEVDSSAPAPPKLTPEAPGAPVPTVVSTPKPAPTAKPKRTHLAAAPPAPSGIVQFAESAFHWPAPLVFEVLLVVLAAYAFVRWRQRYYVEGPP